MKKYLVTLVALLAAFWIFVGQTNPPYTVPPLMMDIQLASPDDDPEPYILQYLRDKEAMEVQKVRVLGAPDTEDVFYVAYQSKQGHGQQQSCNNLWFVKIAIGGDMASGQVRKMPCEEAKRLGIIKPGQRRLTIQYAPSYWPN